MVISSRCHYDAGDFINEAQGDGDEEEREAGSGISAVDGGIHLRHLNPDRGLPSAEPVESSTTDAPRRCRIVLPHTARAVGSAGAPRRRGSALPRTLRLSLRLRRRRRGVELPNPPTGDQTGRVDRQKI